MVIHSMTAASEGSDSDGAVNQEHNMNPDEQLVLALPAAHHQPVNFLHLEIQPEELDAVRIQAVAFGDLIQDIQQVNEDAEEQLNVGVALLPNSIDFNPGLRSYCANNPLDSGSILSKADTTRLCHNPLDSGSILPKADTTKLCEKHFAPQRTGESIQVPASWSDFINLLLLNPERFEWANSLLRSKAWDMIITESKNEITIEYSVNEKCPISEAMHCSSTQSEEQHAEMCIHNGIEIVQAKAPLGSLVMEAVFTEVSETTPTKGPIQGKASVSTSSLHLKRKRAKAPMVISEVRRSDRLKDKNQGYKAESCIDRLCLCCTTVPPPTHTHSPLESSRTWGRISVKSLYQNY
jgi:hypothetical protein